MKNKSLFVAYFLLQTLGIITGVAAEWSCPQNTYLCSSTINICCGSPKCNPNPLALTCDSSDIIGDDHLKLIPLLDTSLGYSQAVKDAAFTAESFNAELKSSVIDDIRIHSLQQCIESALSFDKELPTFLTSLEQNPIKDTVALFAELSKLAKLNIKHIDCRNSIFDALALKRLFESPELTRHHLLGADRSNYLLNQIAGVKLNYFNTAKVYGSVINSAIKQYLKATENEPVVTQDYVDHLNAIQDSWVAKLNPRVANLTRQGLRNLVGWTSLSIDKPPTADSIKSLATASFPANFRVSEQWPNCESSIFNQYQCDGCWAFSSSGVLADRLCIASGGKTKVQLSAQYIVDCDSQGGNCGGGTMEAAWWFLGFIGTTTEQCIPFKSKDGTYLPCGADRLCVSGEQKDYYFAVEDQTVYLNTKDLMKQELLTNGSIQTGFEIYSDFMVYSSGIYVPVSTKQSLGKHATRVVGWGTTNGTEYWIIANSFGTEWGMAGYCNFKTDQLDIEKAGMTGFADLSRTELSSMASFLASPFDF